MWTLSVPGTKYCIGLVVLNLLHLSALTPLLYKTFYTLSVSLSINENMSRWCSKCIICFLCYHPGLFGIIVTFILVGSLQNLALAAWLLVPLKVRKFGMPLTEHVIKHYSKLLDLVPFFVVENWTNAWKQKQSSCQFKVSSLIIILYSFWHGDIVFHLQVLKFVFTWWPKLLA